MLSNCPGSQKFRQPEPETINCPSCGKELEIWTDEIEAVCPGCGASVMRDAGFSCLEWCQYARECVGNELYSRYVHNRSITVKQKLMRELENYFAEDKRRINHARDVMHFAEELLKQESADWYIVIPASILHDIGIKEAERKYNSSAAPYQEKEGPPVARKILLKLGLKLHDIDEICEIIAHHHTPHRVNTQNFKVLYDADWLVNLREEPWFRDKLRLEKMIDKIFLTNAGKKLAREIYLK